MKYSEQLKKLYARYIIVIEQIESGLDPEREAELDLLRQDLHYAMQTLLRAYETYDQARRATPHT